MRPGPDRKVDPLLPGFIRAYISIIIPHSAKGVGYKAMSSTVEI